MLELYALPSWHEKMVFLCVATNEFLGISFAGGLADRWDGPA